MWNSTFIPRRPQSLLSSNEANIGIVASEDVVEAAATSSSALLTEMGCR